MDLLFKRYASPFLFIDGMIQTCRFEEFVNKFANTSVQEKEEEQNWQFFLHKVWQGTYQDFADEIENNKKNMSMSKRTLETTVNHSLDILNNFVPE